MVDAEVERWNGDADEEEGNKDAVNCEIPSEAPLEAQVVHLSSGDGEEKDNDESERKAGVGLYSEVVWSEALDRDVVKGVIVQGTYPDAAEPEDGFLDLCGEAGELEADAASIDKKGPECSRKEAADDDRCEGDEAGVRRRIGDKADVEEEHGKNGCEEDQGRRCGEREDNRPAHRHRQ